MPGWPAEPPTPRPRVESWRSPWPWPWSGRPRGGWMNYGAQYVTDARPTVVELAESLGVELLQSEAFEDYWRMLLPADPGPRAEAERAVARIETEQANRRPLTLPELDGQSFAD